MVIPMPLRPSSPCRRRSRDRGFTLVEALAALAIFTIAVLVASAFLQAHVQAARRLEIRSALVQATETTLEEIRGGTRPMVQANLDRASEFGLAPGAGLSTSIKVNPGGVADLFHVVVTSRSAASGQPMEVTVETMVWRP
jgi:prepilin-type N-terminal cleavage/methylation domain-containing protein